MNTTELHKVAERLARQEGISHGAACAILSRRALAKRRQLKTSKIKSQPERKYWWQND